MKIVGQTLPPRKFKRGDLVGRIIGRSKFVAKVLAYEGPYECIHVEIVSDVFSTLVEFRYYEDPNWWEKV
jgi:hypothetical protein